MAIRIIDSTDTIPAVVDGDQLHFTNGNVPVTAGLDQSASLIAGLNRVVVGSRWSGNIGSFAAPLISGVGQGTGPYFKYNAPTGALWFQTSVAATTLLRATGGGTVNLVGTGTVTTLECLAGAVNVPLNTTCTTIRVGNKGQVNLFGSGGTAPTTVEVTGGTYYSERGTAAGGSITVYAGTCILNISGNTIVTLSVSGGSVSIAQSGGITTLNLLGTADAGAFSIARALTITTLNIWGTVRGASAFVQNALLTITTTNWRLDQGG